MSVTSITERIKRCSFVKRCFRQCIYVCKSIKGTVYMFVVKIAPQIHAKHEITRQKNNVLKQKRIDLKSPENFAEKMLYLKYFVYNKSKLVAQCYNKYEVREYVQKKGCGEILNELYGVWDSVEEIPWKSLPEECVVKVSNGYSNHVFKRRGESFLEEKAINTLKTSLKNSSYYFKISGDLFAYGTKQKIVCEKMLTSRWGYVAPEDYKFYCFHGEPKYCEIMWDRYGKDVAYKEVFVDLDMNDCHELEAGTLAKKIERPVCMDEMIEYAKKLSEDFPFVRVDFYIVDNHPVFGELTFTPMHNQTPESMVKLGKMIDLTRLKEYQHLFE